MGGCVFCVWKSLGSECAAGGFVVCVCVGILRLLVKGIK